MSRRYGCLGCLFNSFFIASILVAASMFFLICLNKPNNHDLGLSVHHPQILHQMNTGQYENVLVDLSYYDPTKGGINCDSDCAHTANGTRILDDYGNPISGYWWNGEYAGVACPPEDPFGTRYVIDFDNEKIILECIDRGDAIVKEGEVYRLDILHYDGVPIGEYRQPVTKHGRILAGGPYQAKRIVP